MFAIRPTRAAAGTRYEQYSYQPDSCTPCVLPHDPTGEHGERDYVHVYNLNHPEAPSRVARAGGPMGVSRIAGDGTCAYVTGEAVTTNREDNNRLPQLAVISLPGARCRRHGNQ